MSLPPKRLHRLALGGVVWVCEPKEECAAMYSTVDECRVAWEAAGKHGSKEERVARNLKWLLYYQNIAAQQECEEAEVDPHAS